MPRSCMAVPGSALSRAEQSVECSLSHGAEPRVHGLPWPVPSRSSMQVASRRAPGLAPARPRARAGATRPGARRTANPATKCPPGAAERHLGRRGRITAGRTWPCIQLRRRRRPAPTAPCIPHAPKTLRNRASRFAYGSGFVCAPRVGSYPKCVVKITWLRKISSSPH